MIRFVMIALILPSMASCSRAKGGLYDVETRQLSAPGRDCVGFFQQDELKGVSCR